MFINADCCIDIRINLIYMICISSGANISSLRATKVAQLAEIYRILCIFFGPPPTSFHWRFRNKKGDVFTEHEDLTPLSFVEQHLNFNVADMVSLISDPRNVRSHSRSIFLILIIIRLYRPNH